MKNKDTGEFELVVGNGQLLSGFFIVVLLFAVAFAMGFIVARAKYQQEPGSVSAAASPHSDNRPSAVAPAPTADPPSPSQPAAQSSQSAREANPPLTQPARDSHVESEEQKTDQPAPRTEAAPGTYWQVGVMARADAARTLLQTVRDMNLPATLSPGPDNTTRVLVGPYRDKAALAKVKMQLEGAGLRPVQHTL